LPEVGEIESLEDLEKLIRVAPSEGGEAAAGAEGVIAEAPLKKMPESMEAGLEELGLAAPPPEALRAPDMETQVTELGVKVANVEKKVERMEALTTTVRSETEDLRKKIEEHEDNIQRLLAIYEVVSDRMNPFAEGRGVEEAEEKPPEEFEFPPSGEEEEFGEESAEELSALESMYALMAETSVSVLVALVEDMKRLGIDTREVERYIPEEVLKR
jgi:hypothetical protein